VLFTFGLAGGGEIGLEEIVVERGGSGRGPVVKVGCYSTGLGLFELEDLFLVKFAAPSEARLCAFLMDQGGRRASKKNENNVSLVVARILLLVFIKTSGD